jgi:AbrB family looped-hinge helix DNA binding protein
MTVFFSKLSKRGRTSIPREVRHRLGLKSGDIIRYEIDASAAWIANSQNPVGYELFAVFKEWASDADEKAYRFL